MTDEKREGSPLYEANIITDVVLSAAVSIGFFIYGWLLFSLTKRVEDVGVEQRDRELVKVFMTEYCSHSCRYWE